FMQRQQKGSQARPKHLNLLIVLLTLFELAQIILVIIAGVKFSGENYDHLPSRCSYHCNFSRIYPAWY
ncbi:hypothetical protein Bpfe_026164, partial [Biomphalaria pfeifferi]